MLSLAVSLILAAAPASPPLPVSIVPPSLALSQDGDLAFRPAVVKSGKTAHLHPFYDRKTPVMTSLDEGTPLKVVAENTPWVRVLVPGGMGAWVHRDYVQRQGALATVTATKLRARSKPSTASGSHVLGLLSKGTELQVIGAKEDWLHVLGGPSIGVWVHKEELDFPPKVDAAWTKAWDQVSDQRYAALVAEAVEVEEPASETPSTDESKGDPPPTEPPIAEGPTPAAEGPTPGTEDPAQARSTKPAIVGVPGTESNEVGVADAAAAFVLPKWSARVAVDADPVASTEAAVAALEEHAQQVTKDLDAFEPRLVAACEGVFTWILLRDANPDLLQKSRRGLTRIDALRRFRDSALAAREDQQALLRDPEKAAAAAAERARRAAAALTPGSEGTWVGILSYRPHQNRNYPFVALRGQRDQRVHCFDGRYYLKDYVGREVAVRGKWRACGKDGVDRVLAIEELRVLPRVGHTP